MKAVLLIVGALLLGAVFGGLAGKVIGGPSGADPFVDAVMKHEAVINGKQLITCLPGNGDRRGSYYVYVPVVQLQNGMHRPGDPCPKPAPGDTPPPHLR